MIRTIPRVIHIEIWGPSGQFGQELVPTQNSQQKRGKRHCGFDSPAGVAKKICSNRKFLLAIEIPSDINGLGGVSRGSISRSYEGVEKILLFILILSGSIAPRCGATVFHSDGSAANVQALVNAARDGDTITLPVGTFSWR